MKLSITALTAMLLASPAVPQENRTQGALPDVSGAEAGARQLLLAVSSGDPALAADFFFPEEAFDRVKDLPVPARYHRKLVRWYQEDILKEHPRFKRGNWRLEKVELGRCKWKAVGTEGNKLPYWSCRGSFVTATDGEWRRRLEIHVLINWGKRWYVTHLGPVRQ
jgi:hypothetical protein